MDKGATVSSGAGGTGVDHWHCIVTNPASKISPEEFTEALVESRGGWRNGLPLYITCRESYDRLLDIEKMGMKIRDSEDEFKGAEFRDEATKLLFAYDYTAKYCARVWGSMSNRPLQGMQTRWESPSTTMSLFPACSIAEANREGRIVGATGVVCPQRGVLCV